MNQSEFSHPHGRHEEVRLKKHLKNCLTRFPLLHLPSLFITIRVSLHIFLRFMNTTHNFTQRSWDINRCRRKGTRADLERGSEAKQLEDLGESQRVAGYTACDWNIAWSQLGGGLRPQCESNASDRHQDSGGNHYLQWVSAWRDDDEL